MSSETVTAEETETVTRSVADQLRDLADLIERHPALAPPVVDIGQNVYSDFDGMDGWAQAAADTGLPVRQWHGSVSNTIYIDIQVGPQLKLSLNVSRAMQPVRPVELPTDVQEILALGGDSDE
jgi:hypothetical protein